MLPLQHNHSMNMQLMAEFSHPRGGWEKGKVETKSPAIENSFERDIDGEGKNAARAAALHHVMGSGGMLADRGDRSRANFTDPVAG